ncbi:MAG: sulfatase-like hydrolase/transferase [Pirellulales bacterium]|nr:sulfatase-like hydrolase/transferase [Pirellulales bacterium]
MRDWRYLMQFCLIVMLMIAGAIAPNELVRGHEPFMGAYIHLPAWFRGHTDEADRHRVMIENLDRFHDSGLRVLIPFVTTTGGKAEYPSQLIPDNVWGSWDPVALMVDEARKRGLQIYPTMCVLASGHDRPDGILKLHPDWALRDKAGQPIGFISPGHPEARAWVVSVLLEIAARYHPDGILLDYCRYPGNEAQMDPVTQAQFEKSHPADQFPPGSALYNDAFRKFKRECLTELMGQISNALRAFDPKPRIAVYMWGAHELKGTRDWRTWADRGYLDMLNLTGYAYRERYGEEYLKVLDQNFRDVAAVLGELDSPVELTICVGIATSHGKIREAAEIEDYLQIGKRHGVHGASFFTWETLQPYLPDVKKAGYLDRFSQTARPAEKPNFLIILADDCTYNDLPIYGGKNARTPAIDRMATEGLTFHHAYLSEAMCQPCRSELYTGLYPMRNGCAWNHSASRPSIESMPHRLGTLGYRVGLAGKVHVQPDRVYPFEEVVGFDRNCVNNPTQKHDLNPIRDFMQRDTNQPFCLIVALVEPHVPWVMGDPSRYPPEKIVLPPNIADTPRTRQDFARYLAEITYMDGQVGEILSVLEKSGQADRTLVFFSSEQGAQFPGCKWTNWNTGLHTALIARWPGRIQAGRHTDALAQYADLLPTCIEAAGGGTVLPEFDGKSFLSVLQGKTARHRSYVYGVHNNIPEGPAYPIRSVSDGQYRYIRNLTQNEIYIEKHVMGMSGDGALNNPYWATWVWDAWNQPRTYHLVKRYLHRPAEELYHTAEDPFELANLAGQPATASIQATLRAELERWMAEQGDPGAPQDTQEAVQAARRGEHLY